MTSWSLSLGPNDAHFVQLSPTITIMIQAPQQAMAMTTVGLKEPAAYCLYLWPSLNSDYVDLNGDKGINLHAGS